MDNIDKYNCHCLYYIDKRYIKREHVYLNDYMIYYLPFKDDRFIIDDLVKKNGMLL